jgi:arylsulfatase A-like enzyme
MKTFRLLILMVGIAGCSADKTSDHSGANSTENKPNIIYILADDLGYSDLGVYGQKIIETPNLDRMAAEGIHFTSHYAGTSVCAPSRCSLMTGKHIGHAEVRGNKQVEPTGQMPLSPEAITVAERLKEAGYQTALIGKWGLGVEGSTGEPNKQGFDYYFGYLDQILAHNYYPEYLVRNGEKVMLENEVQYLDSTAWHRGLGSYSTKKVDYSADLFTKDALRYLDEEREDPFFLYLAYTIPHDNGEGYPGLKMEVPNYGRYKDSGWEIKDQKGYAAMITRMDSAIGLLMQKLVERDLDNNTIVFFSSDNGPEMSYKFADFFDSNGIYRGGKRDLYEGGIRVPLIVRWPGKIDAGTVSSHQSAFWDFLPTACELAGVEPGETDGISFLPELTGGGDQPLHDYLYWEFYERTGSKAIRQGKWKGVKNNLKTETTPALELYDLETDPSESNDVSAQNPEVVVELENLMENAHTPSPNFSFK